jgi:hypothetical protein
MASLAAPLIARGPEANDLGIQQVVLLMVIFWMTSVDGDFCFLCFYFG